MLAGTRQDCVSSSRTKCFPSLVVHDLVDLRHVPCSCTFCEAKTTVHEGVWAHWQFISSNVLRHPRVAGDAFDGKRGN